MTRLNSRSARCANASSPTRWWRTIRSISILSALAFSVTASGAELKITEDPSRDKRVIKRWSVPASPRGIALHDGLLYVGLAGRQSVAAIDPVNGAVRNERILDSEEIAATKELVTLRVDAPRKRLIAANGSDESVSILSLPDLEVLREITLEGEVVRDAIPDPDGRFLYILGRTVRVWDGEGRREIASIDSPEPMAIAVSNSGKLLAIIGSEQFESGRATVVALYDPATLKEIAREPLQTDRTIRSAVFAADDQVIVVAASDWIAEKPLVAKGQKTMSAIGPRITFNFGDLVSSEAICLAPDSGPQILAVGRGSTRVHFIERRCGASGAFTASARKVTTSSIVGAKAWATAYDSKGDTLWATDPEGFVTRYWVPAP